MTRIVANRYTTIERLALSQGNDGRDLSDACDPTGASNLDDAVVQETLWDIIYKASRQIDAYLAGHMTVPIAEATTALTVGTSMTFTNDSKTVTGVGTAFDTELEEGDEIYHDGELFWFGVVDVVVGALEVTLKYNYQGSTVIADNGTERTITIPGWLEIHTRNYALFGVWQRTGRKGEDNPWFDDKNDSRRALVDFQRSKQKFMDGSNRRKDNPSQSGRVIADRRMTTTSLSEYTNPTTIVP